MGCPHFPELHTVDLEHMDTGVQHFSSSSEEQNILFFKGAVIQKAFAEDKSSRTEADIPWAR